VLTNPRDYKELSKYFRLQLVFYFENHFLIGGIENGQSFYFLINRKTGASIVSDKITDDLLGLKGPIQGCSIDNDFLVGSLFVPTLKGNLNIKIDTKNLVNTSVQNKLVKTITEAPEDLDMIIVLYKVKKNLKN
jgi:hypothetical protein